MEYLFELRRRLLLCVIFTFLLFAVLCFFANPLYQWLTVPLVMQLPSTHLIATQITAPFLVPVKFVFTISLILLVPLFFYHLWSFISPALYQDEKKRIWLLLTPSVILFYMGMVFAYFVVLPTLFRFFIKTTPQHVELLPDMSAYLDFAIQILFAFGFAFEVPILVLVLALFNIVTVEKLSAARRYVIVIAFVVAMIVTPPDVLSQTLLAVPMWLLFELGLFLARFLKKQEAKGLTTLSKP